MIGNRFIQFDPKANAKSRFEQMLDLFMQLLTYTNGDANEALQWMNELDKKYQLTDDEYGMGDFIEDLKRNGYLKDNNETGAIEITAKSEQSIRKKSLEEIFGKLKKSRQGDHNTRKPGQGDEISPDHRPFQFGDMLEQIDFTESIRNAQINHGVDSFQMHEDDLQIRETDFKAQTSTVLMIDISHSMILYGEDRITPAKKVAMALSELITTKYPKDTLDIVVFGNDAWPVEIKDLPYLQVGPYHTNTVAGIELAMDILRRRRNTNKQIFMITDGKPTCLKIGNRYYKNAFGLDRKITNRCLNLAAQCKKLKIPITTFMIASDPYLQRFVTEFTETNNGKAFFASLDKLGAFIFRDFESGKRKNGILNPNPKGRREIGLIIINQKTFMKSELNSPPREREGIKTLGELKRSGYKPVSVKDEIRKNLIEKIRNKENAFRGIIGYEDSVIPDTERALLSRHNILFLGLRGQAKTRMARQMTDLMDEYIPVIAGSEVNDDPLKPLSKYAKDMIAEHADETPVVWIHRSERYGEKLATPDVSVADLIGDIDPIKAANLHLSFADERVIHYGIIPRSNRGIFVINEIPDLQARIQVALFNILEEGDIQIRGFKLRMALDILFVFTANPEDYTNRGSIVTPLKDRIQSQILTHYPKNIDTSLEITEQEANILDEQKSKINVSDLVKRLIEQVAFEARSNEYVDKKSGVSARLPISAFENAYSSAERRAIRNNEKQTQVWISDLVGIVPSITGKIELVYEGEQEGPYQVAVNLVDKAIRSQFITYFPNPETLKKRRTTGKASVAEKENDNPYKSITRWFDGGKHLDLFVDMKDGEKMNALYKVEGLYSFVKKYFQNANEKENALLMEFVLHGLASYSLISKKVIEGKIEFKDLIGSMMNLGQINYNDDEDLNDDSFR